MATQVTLNSGAVSSAGSLKLQTNGTTDAVTIDTAQNMGLGVTPSAWYSSYKALQIKTSALAAWGNNEVYLMSNAYGDSSSTYKYLATGSKATSYVQYEGTHLWNTAGTGTAGNPITWTQAMTLDASGNQLLGTTSVSAARLNVFSSNANRQIVFSNNETYYGSVAHNANTGLNEYRTEATGGHGFFKGTSSTADVTIDSSGNLLVGKTAVAENTDGFQVYGTGATKGRVLSCLPSSSSSQETYVAYSSTAAAYRFYVDMAGTIHATSATITAISDIRFKENVRDLDAGLTEVMALKPRLYDWKEGKGANVKNARGFIAQEFEQVFPDLIDEWKDPAPEGEEPYKSVRQDLIPVLVKAIQEQQAIIQQLQADVAALKG